MKIPFTPFLALLSLGAATMTALSAQVSSPTAEGETVNLPTFRVSTERDVGYQAENSVSATRISTPIANLPFTISAFTQQFITDTAPADLNDIVRYAAGVSPGGNEFNSGIDTFLIRGFSQAPQRNGFFESSQGNIYVDPVNIERVEVVKGPAALLYGQVGPGGTVNYITKQPEDKPFAIVSVEGGTYSHHRETIDINQPLLKDTLLFRFNAAYTQAFNYEVISSPSRTTVLSPSLTWKITPKVSLKLDYQSFYRSETPAQVYSPSTEVATPASIVNSLNSPYPTPTAALTGKTGVDAAKGYNDSADPGQGADYPALPKYFSYDNQSDYRKSRLNSFNAELDAQLGSHWLARANLDYNNNDVSFNQTGVGNVYIAPPGSLVYTPGTGGSAGSWATSAAWNALTADQQTAAELAFARQVLANQNNALQPQQTSTGQSTGNPGLISRRPRLQEIKGNAKSIETDLVGDYSLPWGNIKPLVGVSYNASNSYNLIHLNTGSAASPFYQIWDVNPASPTYYINHNPAPIAPANYTTFATDTLANASNQAYYGVINADFLQGKLFVVAGARYNQSRSQNYNFLGATPTAIRAPGFKAHYTTPQVGVGYKVTSNSLLYASYSTAYTFTGGFTSQPQLINGVVTSVNTGSIAPTTSAGEEIGFKTDFFDGRLSSTLAVYRIIQSNGVLSLGTIFPTGTLFSTVQGVTTRSQGIEYELTWSVTKNLQILGSVSEDDIRNTGEPTGAAIFLGAHPQWTAKTLGNLWSRYNFTDGVLKNLWVGGGFNFTSKTNANSPNPYDFFPGYVLWNSAVGYDWKWEKEKFSAAINWFNMTNKYYRPAHEMVGLPSRATLSLRVTF
jgi:iron complex outermembrane receptor protein